MNYTTDRLGGEWKDESVRFEVGSLCAALSQLGDKRKRRGVRYPLAVVLTLMVLAKLAGEDTVGSLTPEVGLVLGQETVANHENELVVAPDLLQSLNIEGTVITGDALFTQRTLSQQIIDAGGYYL